jgi:hypothetical protein
MIFRDFHSEYDNSHYTCASYYETIGRGKKGGRLFKKFFYGWRCDYHHIFEHSILLAEQWKKFEWQNDEIKMRLNEHLGGIT